MKDGVDHCTRSREIAEEFLSQRNCPEMFTEHVLECIEHHHSGDPNQSIEAILLSDTDALDFIGTVGIFRILSKFSGNPRAAIERVKQRYVTSKNVLCLESSRTLAVPRLEETERLINSFEDETFGLF